MGVFDKFKEIVGIEDVDDDDENQMPLYMRGNVRASREFDDDEYKIFCRYDGMEAIKAQLEEVGAVVELK